MAQKHKFPLPSLSHAMFMALPTEAQQYLRFLETQIVLLTTRIEALTVQTHSLSLKLQELEGRLAQNSSNSNKPPSSDGLKKVPKTSSLRGKSKKKPGGQEGHSGSHLQQVPNPEIIKTYVPSSCKNCFYDLNHVSAISVEKRQVFDLPKIQVIVTEHQAETKKCPCCGHKTKGIFPHAITSTVQYGERIQALAAYFGHQHLIPFERISQIFSDLYGISLSAGTCVNMDNKLFKNLEPFESDLKAHLLKCKVLHFDETSVRCEKSLYWIHVVSAASATFYGLHKRRGQQAIDAHNILPQFKGIAVHDHWFPYFAYTQVRHALCNAHHLRELKYIQEHEKVNWAKKMSNLLLKAKKMTEQAKEEGKETMATKDLAMIEREYAALIIKIGTNYLSFSPLIEEIDPIGIETEPIGGRTGFNLFKRLLHKKDYVLGFLYDLAIPFSNNLAEQDIRMEKVKQKISGCFRTFKGGEISCRIRSYISTAKKQGWILLDALIEAVKGSPRLLSILNT